MFGGALAMIFGVLCVGSEYGWGTVKTILAQRPSRSAVIGGKFAVLAIAMITVVTSTFAIDAGVIALVASSESRAIDWPPFAEVAKGYGVGLLIVSMWGAIGAFLGTVLRGTPVGIGLGLVWALVVENLVRGLASLLAPIEALQKILPGTNGGALVAALGAPVQSSEQGTPGVTDAVSGTHAASVMVGYVVL
ncbi:MAG: ABC transporter permease subunit, partial [Pseudonocardiaceae bacterium]